MGNRGRNGILIATLLLCGLAFYLYHRPDAQVIEAAKDARHEWPKAHALKNAANEFGKAAFFETAEQPLWNPTVLVLPFADEKHRYLLTTGALHTTTRTHVSDRTTLFRQATCFLKTPLDFHGGRPSYQCAEPLQSLDLPVPPGAPFALCSDYDPLHANLSDDSRSRLFDPLNARLEHDDSRLWLTDDGVPLMTWVSNHPTQCRGMSVIDARAVIPDLNSHLRAPVSSIPLVYTEPLRLTRENPQEIDKNWALIPSSDKKLTFYVSLSPNVIVEDSGIFGQSLVTIPNHHSREVDCVSRLTEHVPNTDALFRGTQDMNHLGTPFLRLKMCKSGQCPRSSRTVLFGIINRKRKDFMYDTRALVIDSVKPYRQLSLSQPLTYVGVSARDFAFTHNIVWRAPRFEEGNLIGYLDDHVLISFGISDSSGAMVEIAVEDLLASQMACD